VHALLRARRYPTIIEVEFEEIVIRHGGQPHLGKKVSIDRERMEGIYGSPDMERFRRACQAQDPAGKFLNEFTERVLA
jgi:FAD/FMN-containing dehydrogenase